MPERLPVAALLILAGVALIVLGGLFWLGALSWFGKLPGDIRVERPGVSFYLPITSMIVVSVVLTLLMSAIRRLWP